MSIGPGDRSSRGQPRHKARRRAYGVLGPQLGRDVGCDPTDAGAAYKGQSKLEDYALNFAGFNAFLVALVPNSFPDLLTQALDAERAGVATTSSRCSSCPRVKMARS